MSRDEKFIIAAKDGKYTSVKRYLKSSYWNTYMCNQVLTAAMMNDDEKMFNILINNDMMINNVSSECFMFVILSKRKHDSSTYFRRIIAKRGFDSLKRTAESLPLSITDEKLINLYLQVSRLNKLHSIRKKMLNK